jgi:hypothetical protein
MQASLAFRLPITPNKCASSEMAAQVGRREKEKHGVDDRVREGMTDQEIQAAAEYFCAMRWTP